MCLWGQRPMIINGKTLAGFDAQRIAQGLVAVVELLVECVRVEIAVIPVDLGLTIDIEAIIAIPGGSCTQSPALRADVAIAKIVGDVGMRISILPVIPAISLPLSFSKN